jgi:general secretion pathway protein A
MYEQFYNLRERPFELTPNPRYLLMTATHREALSILEYGISGRKGMALLVGDAGTGKTTLIHAALESHARDRLVVYLNNPSLTRSEFFEFLALGFGLPPEAGSSKTRFLVALTKALTDGHAQGRMAALIVDEAQCLPDRLLEEVRLLANLQSSADKLLSIIMVGQPELAERLNHPALRQFKQRIELRCTLKPLNEGDTAAYIANRIYVAGGDCSTVFTREAIETIFARSGGIPRAINVICDNALVAGFALDHRPVDKDVVIEVCRDLEFAPPESPAAGDEAPAAEPEAPAPAPAAPGRSTLFSSVTVPDPTVVDDGRGRFRFLGGSAS